MNKFFSLITLLSINSLYAMKVAEVKQKVIPGSRTGEFSYEAMEKTVGPSYVLTNQTYSVPFYEPADREPYCGGDDILHQAVRENDVEKVSALLDSGKSAHTLNRFGVTPLFFVRSLKVTKLLLNEMCSEHHNASVNVVEQSSGMSPLHFIVQGKDEEIPKVVELLLAKGAKVNALSWNYHTPLTFAKHGRPDVVALLKSKGAEDSFETLDVINKAVELKPKK